MDNKHKEDKQTVTESSVDLQRLVIPHKEIHNEKCELLRYLENFLVETAPKEQIEEEIKNSFYRLF